MEQIMFVESEMRVIRLQAEARCEQPWIADKRLIAILIIAHQPRELCIFAMAEDVGLGGVDAHCIFATGGLQR